MDNKQKHTQIEYQMRERIKNIINGEKHRMKNAQMD